MLIDQPRVLNYITKDNIICGFDCQMDKMKNNYEGMTVGGFTTQSFKEIFLFKKEEVGKLLIHEVAHLIDLDVFPKDKTYLNPWQNDKNEIRVYEAYSELVSCILNAIFMACEYALAMGLDKTDILITLICS